MGMDRIQFQEGMSLFELFQHWSDDAPCEAAVEQARRPAGLRYQAVLHFRSWARAPRRPSS
jgi:hypothetical protein